MQGPGCRYGSCCDGTQAGTPAGAGKLAEGAEIGTGRVHVEDGLGLDIGASCSTDMQYLWPGLDMPFGLTWKSAKEMV